MDDAQVVENKRSHLQTLINAFESQADTVPIPSLLDYDDFDYPDNDNMATPHWSLRAPDGSGIDTSNPEDIPIFLPSSLGWKRCSSHNAKSLALKEAKLRHAQANDAIHQICLALGFKSALFCDHVHPAHTQQTKTQAWNAVHNVDSTLSGHLRIYSMARDAYRKLCNKTTIKAELSLLTKEDLYIATMVLGSEIMDNAIHKSHGFGVLATSKQMMELGWMTVSIHLHQWI